MLTVGGKVVSEVAAVPFEYTLAAEELKEGVLKIELSVEDDGGNRAADAISVTIEDQNIAPVCAITAPEANATFEQADAIVVTGTGSDEDGTIANVVLKINGQSVEAVTAVPFEYTLTDEQKSPGNVVLTLEVTDNHGKTAANEVTIVILGREREFTDVRDGKVYKAVKIGTQVWMAENLAYLPEVMPASELSEEKPCYHVYDYNGTDVAAAKATESYKTRGVLYNWVAASGDQSAPSTAVPSGVRGSCPEGWHLPSKAEWEILFDYVRKNIPDSEAVPVGPWDPGITVNGQKVAKNINIHLRAKDGWLLKHPDLEQYPGLARDGLDTYGLGIQATGYKLYSSFTYGPGTGQEEYCYLWSSGYSFSDDYETEYKSGVTITSYHYEPQHTKPTYSWGQAVRCVQD